MHTQSRGPHAHNLAAAHPTFFVRVEVGVELPPRAQVERHLQRFVMATLGGWLQLAVLERLVDGRAQWSGEQTGVDNTGRERLFVVRCEDLAGPRRPGLWAALTLAHGLAELLGGAVIDPRRTRPEFGPQARLRAPADGRVRTINHLCVASSAGVSRRRWLTSVGMGHFGLPDLELVEVAPAQVELGARLMLGVAQHLIEAAWQPPSRHGDERPREAVLTVGDLHWALGAEPGAVPLSRGRGWTRVALGFDHARAWPELLRLRPPSGARRWRSTGAWLRDAWADLHGPPPSVQPRAQATG